MYNYTNGFNPVKDCHDPKQEEPLKLKDFQCWDCNLELICEFAWDCYNIGNDWCLGDK